MRSLFVWIVALVLSACGTLSRLPLDADDQAAQRLARSDDLATEVDAMARPLVDEGQTPGILVGILRADGSRQFFQYGVADKASGAPLGPDTLFAVGSLSKGFLAEITAGLVQEGALHWDDTLGQLLPAGARLSADARKITLQQLATHTSGLPRQPMTPRMLLYFGEYLLDGHSFYRNLDQDYILGYLADFRAPGKPEIQYSNIGYGLLTFIVEHRTGKTVDVLLEEKLKQPLGLHSTTYEPDQLEGYALRARGYAGDQPKFIRRGQPVPDWRFTPAMRGGAALYTTAQDLLTYAAAHLHAPADPRLAAALQDSLTPRLSQGNESAALAWTIEDVGGHQIVYQVGLVAGYSSYIGLDLKSKVAVVVLQNSFNWTSIGHRLITRMARAQELRE